LFLACVAAACGGGGSGAGSAGGSGDTGGGGATSSGGACNVTVTTSDSYSKIEDATPGQTVCISPGTYHFRVTLAKAGTASAPIVIRALDPASRPVFDYTSTAHDVTGWPGSYSASDAVRSAWRVTGAYYVIDGIVILGANNSFDNWSVNDNTAGIRYLNSSHLTIRNCWLYNNDMGVQGGGSETLIEYAEFDHNGVPNSDQSHNLYVLGGDNLTLRYSYLHDSVGGQNFHVRARNATLAYNWFENAADYEGDMMTNQTSYDPGANGVQSLLFIGNVVVQNPTPGNEGKLITLYNDGGTPNPTMNLTAVWNTFVFREARRGTDTAPIQFSKATLAGGTIVFSNNIVSASGARSAVITDSGSGTLALSGTNNFFPTGSSVAPLINTKFAVDVLFGNANGNDYTLQATSQAAGYANTTVAPQPAWRFTAMPIAGALVSDKVSARTTVSNPGALQ
jgi:hypothetical protein